MADDERLYAIRSLIFEYAKSPSLRHIREPYFVDKLAKEILRVVDRGTGPWEKWCGAREALLTASATTWIPVEDLRDYFNTMPGQPSRYDLSGTFGPPAKLLLISSGYGLLGALDDAGAEVRAGLNRSSVEEF